MSWNEINNLYDLWRKLQINDAMRPHAPQYKWQCNTCGHLYWTSTTWASNHQRCPRCYLKLRYKKAFEYMNVIRLEPTRIEVEEQKKAFIKRMIQAQKNKIQWLEFIHQKRLDKIRAIIADWEAE